ncbi:MAG: helix-turn-helix domain-containing protein, partial [Planctomycetes bacterium]|nr:helix-turn-helix domain-containing protein [Planctomycetota bacterium]
APAAPAPAGDRVLELALAVKARLDRGGHDELSLRSELRRLGHSYEHLCRCFTRSFGIPPLRYLQLARVERAKALLAEPGATVVAVAAALGCRDLKHFTRVFRACTGTTPGRWRGSPG